MLAVLLLVPLTITAQAGSPSKKQIAEAKAKERELREDGWKLYGKADTLALALLAHYMRLETMGQGSQELCGIVCEENPKRMDDLFNQAKLQAKSVYVKQRHSYIVSKAVTELGLSADGKSEFETFYSASRLNAEGAIKNELQDSYALIRETPSGHIEIVAFYIVTPDEAAHSNIQAFRNFINK